MAKLYDITNWNEQSWWNTGGTRDKKIYLNPDDNELYYFKQSFKKGQRDYKHEFWSEIVASEIGTMIGFDVLAYHIAIHTNTVGCISKSMISQTSEELIEGGKYLQAFDNTFNPENAKLRHEYTFELISASLAAFKKDVHFSSLIETIVFDAFIGNSDRHQENWAIINTHTLISDGLTQIVNEIESPDFEKLPSLVRKFIKTFYVVKGKVRPELKQARLMLPKQTRFAPIYDSGCSFGRELNDDSVINLLNNTRELEKYVNKGLAEMHWENKKTNHFQLINNLLLQDKFREMVVSSISKIIIKFDVEQVKKIVTNIDESLKQIGNPNTLPDERKALMIKILSSRFEKLKEIYSKVK